MGVPGDQIFLDCHLNIPRVGIQEWESAAGRMQH